MIEAPGPLEGGYNYELREPNEPWLIVRSKNYSTIDPLPFKVMRYGIVFNGFYSKREALEWAGENFS